METIVSRLSGGDLRSIGEVEEIVAAIIKDASLFADVFQAMSAEDPVVRMRAADAIEKVTRKEPQYLQPVKQQLLREVSQVAQQEVQWHVAQMLPRLALEPKEASEVIKLLESWLKSSKSKIVQVNSLQAMVDIAAKHTEYQTLVFQKLGEVIESGSPALQSRGKKLMKLLDKNNFI
ncbi:MAG: hypothetical protein H6Q73_2282 [Firmicutes bacterium]|nr:hypothetical protein [Bacillota bacterium]